MQQKRLAKGDFEVELKVNRIDEIGELTQSYVEMAGELKQLEQMRQDFVSNVSHEIQTPLTSISGFAKALLNHDLIVEEERSEYLDIIIAESERLSRLSDNLLKLASWILNIIPSTQVPSILTSRLEQSL